MKGDLWLAVGDETGSWDDSASPKQFMGVALVMAKVSDWKSAQWEKVKGQTIEQRMKQPLQNLPQGSTSNTHHVIDALNYFKKRSVRGLWSLDEVVEENTPVNRLKNELCANLAWLATHPRLITIGAYGKGKWIWNQLNLAKDPAQALGRAYALLAASVVPFLKDEDTLLVAPAPRSENTASEARQRAIISQSNSQQRADGDTRGTISTLLDHSQQILRTWQKGSVPQTIDSGVFVNLRKKYIKNVYLNINVLNNIADLGAALMTLSQNPNGNIRLHDPNQTWRNVKFFKFEELLP